MNHELFTEEGLATAPPELSIVLDCTASMRKEMRTLPRFLVRYVLHRAMADNPITAVSIVGFDDHYLDLQAELAETKGRSARPWAVPLRSLPPSANLEEVAPWAVPLRSLPPSANLEEVAFFLHTLPLGDGADRPEAVACALDRSRKLHPYAQRWLITDAMPHGHGARHDDFPDGCPCGVAFRADDVAVLLPDRWQAMGVQDFWKTNAKNVLLYPDDEGDE